MSQHTPCKCEGLPDRGDGSAVEYCALHATAPELLELLEAIALNRRNLNDEHFAGVADRLFAQINAAIAKAKGQP